MLATKEDVVKRVSEILDNAKNIKEIRIEITACMGKPREITYEVTEDIEGEYNGL